MTDPEVIILAVCEKFDITEEELKKKDRTHPIVFYRHIAIRLLRRHTTLILRDIAVCVGLKDHHSVKHAIKNQKINPFESQFEELEFVLRIGKSTIEEENVLANAFVFTSVI